MMTKTHFDFSDTSTAFAIRNDSELRRMHLLFAGMNNSALVKLGTYLLIIALKLRLPIKYFIKKTVFKHFCGGETIEECIDTIQSLHQSNITAILDYSAEGEKNAAGFHHNKLEMFKVIDAAKELGLPFCVVKLTGFASFDVLANIQAGSKDQSDLIRLEGLRNTLDELAKKVSDKGLCLFIDAEESWIQDVIDGLAYDAMKRYNKERAVIYNTYQMYRHESLANLKKAHEELSAMGVHLGAKIVRGAYMEKERERANKMGYVDPIQPDKQSTDRDYDLALAYCVENIHNMALCAGTHNEKSSAYLADLMDQHNIAANDPRIYFSQLYGMSDTISYTVAKAGYNVAKYLPYGEINKVMPYLVRRAEENTAIAGQASRELQLIRKEINRRKQSA